MEQLPLYIQILLIGLVVGSLYGIVAIGIDLVYNVTTFLNFAQAEFGTFGALLAISLTQALSWPLPLAILLSILAAIILGLFTNVAFVNPIRNSPHIIVVLVTMALMEALQGVWMVTWGVDPLTLPSFSGIEPIGVFGAAITKQALWMLGTVLVLGIGLFLFFKASIFGKAMKACAENRDIASTMGINVRHMELLSFGISGAIGAIGGIVMAPMYSVIYNGGTTLLLMGMISAIVGGLGNVIGGLAGGLILGLLSGIGGAFISQFKDAVIFLGLLIILVLRPRGILGGWQL